ncbi:MAG: 30S ribosomal protein S16 [Planctomycetota bacterium]|nr:30S ribosomal protein S16 [Planctomycetota bacterium]
MAVVIRMKRTGRRNRPCYRISVADSRSPRDGRILETIGLYDPVSKDEEKQVTLKVERAQEWLRNGAKPSETVHSIFKRQGVYTEDLERSKLAGKIRRRPGRKKATETSKRRAADKAARAERKTARRSERVAAARAAKAVEASSDDE